MGVERCFSKATDFFKLCFLSLFFPFFLFWIAAFAFFVCNCVFFFFSLVCKSALIIDKFLLIKVIARDFITHSCCQKP